MPAVITHDRFGREALSRAWASAYDAGTERDAFLLGNQGPDPLFYLGPHPTLHAQARLGSYMHAHEPSRLLAAISHSVAAVPEDERRIARAYASGFACHYALDRVEHPFIYAQQYALCDAGVEGLSREDGSEVHAVIESELDELVLYTRTGTTVATFQPHVEILNLSDAALPVVSRQVAFIFEEAYGMSIDAGLFATAVRCFRLVQRAFDSPSGRKRAALQRIEQLVRPYSFVAAMSHRPVELEHSMFDNAAREPWTDPFTQATCTQSFFDLYDAAMDDAEVLVGAVATGELAVEQARELTRGLNFSGKPVEDAPAPDEGC